MDPISRILFYGSWGVAIIAIVSYLGVHFYLMLKSK